MDYLKNRIIYLPSENHQLHQVYESVFKSAKEIFILSAYLTEWEFKTEWNNRIQNFNLIFGRDFGISRKKAIRAALKWLPNNKKHCLQVAENIQGFHPKCMFWSEKNKYYSLIGSSNLTNAAFQNNYEINVISEINRDEYNEFRTWYEKIKTSSIPVSEDWIKQYVEANFNSYPPILNKNSSHSKSLDDTHNIILNIKSNIYFDKELIEERQEQLKKHQTVRLKLLDQIKKCANGEISNSDFYNNLNRLWNWERDLDGNGIGNRLQSRVWQITGKKADFGEFCRCFLKIIASSPENRDSTILTEIDFLESKHNPLRRSVLSELLCLEYPDLYPILNKPIIAFLKDYSIGSTRGASESSKYIDLAMKLRTIVKNLDNVTNLAELDMLIQHQYRA